MCTAHQGFVRLAIAERATLVPVYVDGEAQCVGNAAPAFTAACYRWLGLPLAVPYLKGRPHVTVRYGRPIDASPEAHGAKGGGDAFEEIARAFWAELAALRADARAGGPCKEFS